MQPTTARTCRCWQSSGRSSPQRRCAPSLLWTCHSGCVQRRTSLLVNFSVSPAQRKKRRAGFLIRNSTTHGRLTLKVGPRGVVVTKVRSCARIMPVVVLSGALVNLGLFFVYVLCFAEPKGKGACSPRHLGQQKLPGRPVFAPTARLSFLGKRTGDWHSCPFFNCGGVRSKRLPSTMHARTAVPSDAGNGKPCSPVNKSSRRPSKYRP